MQIKISTWNINSARLRENIILRHLKEVQPDILCLQEIKCLPEQFPRQSFEDMGYRHIEISGQKAYHGAATLSRFPLQRMDTDFCPAKEARHVSTHVLTDIPFELHNFYVPAGGDEPNFETNPKFRHKFDFLTSMQTYFSDRTDHDSAKVVIVGDLNIAPHENDVWSHKQLLKVVSHTPIEVEALNAVQAAFNFTDCSRHFAEETDKLYSWWSYRARDVFASNRGRRLDHIWVSPALIPAIDAIGPSGHEILTDTRIWDKPSDHVPLTQVLKLDAV